jgi:alpha-L-rhamnosidase
MPTSSLIPVRLRCNYLVDPIGIDLRVIHLSWLLAGDGGDFIGAGQKAYEIEVREDGATPVWKTGRVASAEHTQIPYAGKALGQVTRYLWRVRAWDARNRPTPWSAEASWVTGPEAPGWSIDPRIDIPGFFRSRWIGSPPVEKSAMDEAPIPYLRKEFSLPAKPLRAFLFASAMGIYEARLNGRRVGDRLLAPEWTNYDLKAQYQGYDVTALLKRGPNAIGALLGPGWYAGELGMPVKGRSRCFYGVSPNFHAQLHVDLPGGKHVCIISDPTWRISHHGPVRSAEIFNGETYDARLEMKGWDQPGFADKAWKKAEPFRGPKMVAQPNEPVRVTQKLAPRSLVSPSRGTHIYDFGQNLVGWVKFTLRGKRGQKITLRFGEALQPNGQLYTENLREAKQTDTYICRGGRGEEAFEPHFTYHGFRYLEVRGFDQAPALSQFTALAFHSDVRRVGTIETSNGLVNRLMTAIDWTLRDNLHGIPTDCPQRDERMGWSGDAQIFAQTAMFLRDMAGFFTKYSRDLRDSQARDGRFPDICPHPHGLEHRFSGNPGWGDAGVIIPWRLFVNYGDRAILAEQFEAARRWVDWITCNNPTGIWKDFSQLVPMHYGDWLNSDTFKDIPGIPKKGGMVPHDIFATAYYAYSTELVARMARVLGQRTEEREYTALAKRIRAVFNKCFVARNGKITGDTQAGYALALDFDLLPAAQRTVAARHMVAALRRRKGALSTGFHSTVSMMKQLTKYGFHREAYALLLRTDMPSWGYMLEHGGTTIWERWDGWVDGRGFQDPGMNSFCHYAIGAVGEWIWRTVAGLSPDESAPGWRHFFVRPVPGGGLTWARARYESIRGPIEVSWKIEGGRFEIETTVPVHATATLTLPGSTKSVKLKPGRHVHSCAWKSE